MSSALTQRSRVIVALTPQDITTQRIGPYLDVSAAQRILAAINTGIVAQTKTVTVQLMQAQDATGTGAKLLGTATVLTAPTGGATLPTNIDVKIGDLDHNNGFGFVAVQLLSNNSTAVYAGAMLVEGSNRYNP